MCIQYTGEANHNKINLGFVIWYSEQNTMHQEVGSNTVSNSLTFDIWMQTDPDSEVLYLVCVRVHALQIVHNW